GLQGLPLAASGEPVGAFILHVAGVALHPVPDNLIVTGDGGIELPPQVLVLDRLTLLGTPTFTLPARHPRHDAVADASAVGVQVDDGGAGGRSQGRDGGGQFDPVVRRGSGLAAAQFLLDLAVAQQRTPTARPRVAAARTVGPDLYPHRPQLRHPDNLPWQFA